MYFLQALFFISAFTFPVTFSLSIERRPRWTPPPASCYDQNGNDGIAAIPRFPWNYGLNDPNNIAQGPNGIYKPCFRSNTPFVTVQIPAGYKLFYGLSNADNPGFRADCDELAADAKALAEQCPYGGVLQHYNSQGHKGNVYLQQVNGPNLPPPPGWYDECFYNNGKPCDN